MRSFKKIRLTASDCEVLRQSPEGTAALTQPLNQRPGSQDSRRRLGPTPRRRRRQPSKGHQRTITDYFKSRSHAPPCSSNMAESHKAIVEEPPENFACDWPSDSDDSCSLLDEATDTLAPPKKLLRFSHGSGDSDRNAGREVRGHEPWLVRLPGESPGDGTVKQEARDAEVDPLPDAHFGLFGTTSGDDVPQGTMEKLPDELLQEIFALVPLVDLLQNLCLVCRRWKCIISDVKFIPWKKIYYQYLKGVDHASLTLRVILQRYGLTKKHPQCMLGFIRCAAAIRSCRCKDPAAVLACLKRHSLFLKAEVCIAKNLPDLDGRKEKPAYVRALMAAMVLLAGGVGDVQEMVACLQRPSSTMSLTDILEMLYSTATLLYAMRDNEVHISNRLHYNVFYCLYHLENFPCGPAVEHHPTLGLRPVLQLTSEQQQILNHALAPGEVVKIVAFAGTGKTSTLLQYTRKWDKLNFLYLAFNSTIAKQAEVVFPGNVTCKTIHSLAFAEVGKHYKHKLNLGSLTSYLVSFVLSNRKGQSPFIRAKTVVQTLAAFFASADAAITVEHTPIWCKNNQGINVLVEEREKHIIVEEAKQIWAKMKMRSPTTDMAHRMTHDGYLKLWQLQKPSLSNYDAILVDEAQDCTPAVMDIVLSQTCGVILVGDPHQQIYTFRGAVNSLLHVPHSRIFYLTQSFRFGSEIAYVGATLLDICKKVRKKTLVGNTQESDVRGVGVEGKEACLSRNNQTVFEDAVNRTGGDSPAKIHLLGGLKAFGLEKISDLWKLLHPELKLEIKDPFIKRWVEKGLASIKDYAAKAEDKQLEMKIAIVEKYRERIPELLDRISRCHVPRPENADCILGTVHKAKGLEFDTVRIAGDFVNIPFTSPYPGMGPRNPFTIPEDEWNLLYVAVTRAKKRLIMSRNLADILKISKEYYTRFELTEEVGKKMSLWCSEQYCCNSIPADSPLIPQRINFVYADGTKTPEGLLCPSCAVWKLGPIAQLTRPTWPTREQDTASPPEDIEVPSVVGILLQVF
ncbi:F-box DNA helicase 1 [Thamnophis elegans]|uniref:F-box DNA helicase 1 n=1 Tax=Thamnophis elegans TaxID=35005 RepID=UPI001377F4C9|nr:F-box DNA helicase 1 [Thamnophis elegans]